VGFCGIFEQFPGFEFFQLPGKIHARPHAGNAFIGLFRLTPHVGSTTGIMSIAAVAGVRIA